MTWREQLLACLFAIVAGPVLMALTLSIMWGWFVVPLGVPAIGMAWAYGLVLLVRYASGTMHIQSTVKTPVEVAANAVLEPAILLGFGWVALQFMAS